MRAGIIKEYDKRFLLDEGKLRKMSEILDSYSRKLDKETELKYTIVRDDNSFYETEEIDDILSEDNSNGKQINKLYISIEEKEKESKEQEIYLMLTFDKIKNEINFKN